MKDVTQTLKKVNLRTTQMRREVLEMFHDSNNQALSSKDIESRLDSIDRITLYRTLKTFEEMGLIHQAVDASGKTKYALCQDNCSPQHHSHDHAHFHCEKCEKTICIEARSELSFEIPEGFKLQQTHVILNGICPECNG